MVPRLPFHLVVEEVFNRLVLLHACELAFSARVKPWDVDFREWRSPKQKGRCFRGDNA